ncbi:response regulator transcription factor [Nonomuraea angiospora]|uniref:response regulator transcription factor n=1 Tax=Nonomuraea angiospora TaxID=46172 RepID=UPI00344CFD57
MFTALVVDDEPQMTAIIAFALKTQGFQAIEAHDGATAMHRLRTHQVDLAVLDVLMPGLDGLSLCQMIKAQYPSVAIVLVTALSRPEEVIAGLERGADDYVTKPFHPMELVLRARAVLRRYTGPALLRIGDLVIDAAQRTVTIGGRRLTLTDTECRLLAHLAARRGTPQSWQDLLREVWGTTELAGGRDVVKSTVYRLRSALEALDAASYVQTVRGAGYMMPDRPDR